MKLESLKSNQYFVFKVQKFRNQIELFTIFRNPEISTQNDKQKKIFQNDFSPRRRHF